MKSPSKRLTKPSVPVRALPRIVRETCIFTERQTSAQIEARIAATKDRALSVARQTGIKCPEVTEMYDVHVVSTCLDYPIYLLGPNAPRIKTYQDALMHGDGRGQYAVIIRSKD